jgi:hypothetical protein
VEKNFKDHLHRKIGAILKEMKEAGADDATVALERARLEDQHHWI